MAGVLGDEAPLRFDVATSSLTSLIARAKQSASGRIPPRGLFEVLQKLQLSINRTERSIIWDHQRRAEDALLDIIRAGTDAPASHHTSCQLCFESVVEGSLFTRAGSAHVDHGQKDDAPRHVLGHC